MIEPAFRKLLADNQAVTAIAADRLWLGARPQGERRPGVVLTLTSSEHAHTFEGHGGYVNGSIQLDCLAPDYQTAKELTAAVIAAIDNYTGTVAGTVIDLIEVDGEADIPRLPLEGQAVPSFGVSIDASFQYQK